MTGSFWGCGVAGLEWNAYGMAILAKKIKKSDWILGY